MPAPFAGIGKEGPGLSLPPHLARQVWRGGQLGRAAGVAVPTGQALLDAELPGGGWPVGALTELLLAQHGMGEIRLLAEALRRLTAAGPASRQVLLIGPPYQPYAPALAAWGIALERVIWVRGPAQQALWAAEQALKHSGVGAVLLWLSKVPTAALRRLQVLAQDGQALLFLLRPASAASQSSPAPLRILCRVPVACPPACRNTLDQHASCLQLEIFKRRGPALAAPLHLRLPLEMQAGWPRSLPQAEPLHAARWDRERAGGLSYLEEDRHVVDRRDAARLAARSRPATALVGD